MIWNISPRFFGIFLLNQVGLVESLDFLIGTVIDLSNQKVFIPVIPQGSGLLCCILGLCSSGQVISFRKLPFLVIVICITMGFG